MSTKPFGFSFALASLPNGSKLRIGTLDINGHTISTPHLVTYSKRGAPLHLTRDNTQRLPIDIIHVSLEHLLDSVPPAYTQAPFSMTRYFGLHSTRRFPKSPLIIMGPRDPTDLQDVPYNTDAYVSVRGPLGIVKLKPSDFASISRTNPPDIILALSDQVALSSSKKRLEKSFNRSIKWLEELIASAEGRTHIFATLLAGNSTEAREEWSQVLMGPPGYSQFLKNGAYDDPSSPDKIDDRIAGYAISLPPPESKESLVHSSTEYVPISKETLNLLKSSFAPLTLQKPRLALAVDGPHQILSLISSIGVDLFVDGWSQTLVGVALDFTFPPPPNTTGSQIAYNLFDSRYKEDTNTLSPSDVTSNYEILFNEDGAQPTRAYVHHLLKTHEMTGLILLNMHNTIVMRNFIERVREVMERNEAEFKKACEDFYAAYDGTYSILEEAKKDWMMVERQRGKGRAKYQGGLNSEKGNPTEIVAST